MSSSPNAASLKDELSRLFGRGSCDAKGPMVAMLEAMRRLISARDTWSGTLLGVFVADEEVGSLSAKTNVKQSPQIDYSMIGEPTSCTTVTAHKGSLRPLVRVYGKTAHSRMPDLGVNAILKSARLLEMVVEEHQRKAATSHPQCGNASLTITRAQGGHADTMVPEHCDFVPTTGGASETDPDDPIVAACQDAGLAHNGAASTLSGFQGGCDLVHFRAVGARGVVLGPGELAVAHQPNEYVPVDDLVRSVLIYQQTAMTLLGAGCLPNQET